MKNCLIFFFLLNFLFSVRSQEICFTQANPDNLLSYNDNDYLLPNFGTLNFCVKIYIHVIRRYDGSGGQSVANVNTAIGFLNMDFNPHGIYFNWDGSIDYINTKDYSNASENIFSINNHSDGVDIYLFGDDSGGIYGWGNGGGFANGIGAQGSSFFVTGYFIDNVSLIYPLCRSHVISHEMGHVLNLFHTHHGTVFETGDTNQCPELVNSSNSLICGDYVADTHADPNMGYNVDLVTCKWLSSGFDANGDAYIPDELNTMSYSQPKCMSYITPLQAQRTKKSLFLVPHLQNISTYSTSEYPCQRIVKPLVFYPNPAKNNITLDLRDRDPIEYNYKIYNNQGILLQSGTTSNVLRIIDTSALQNGDYYLHFYEDSVPIIKRIIINH